MTSWFKKENGADRMLVWLFNSIILPMLVTMAYEFLKGYLAEWSPFLLFTLVMSTFAFVATSAAAAPGTTLVKCGHFKTNASKVIVFSVFIVYLFLVLLGASRWPTSVSFLTVFCFWVSSTLLVWRSFAILDEGLPIYALGSVVVLLGESLPAAGVNFLLRELQGDAPKGLYFVVIILTSTSFIMLGCGIILDSTPLMWGMVLLSASQCALLGQLYLDGEVSTVVFLAFVVVSLGCILNVVGWELGIVVLRSLSYAIAATMACCFGVRWGVIYGWRGVLPCVLVASAFGLLGWLSCRSGSVDRNAFPGVWYSVPCLLSGGAFVFLGFAAVGVSSLFGSIFVLEGVSFALLGVYWVCEGRCRLVHSFKNSAINWLFRKE